ncbi:MAG TPA: ABC transporter ATP-binding protein [Candidatus Scybalomonas excrementigallinarum]|nr:ABC transporter ATP-binding protein [Candidatus Scybalomonas excrementigallinarum]
MKIELKNIEKQYGEKQVLYDINLTFEKGMVGLLGENGAGKTTLLKIMSSLSSPTKGEILIDNEPLKKKHTNVRGRIGYLPQMFTPYPFFSVYEFMDYMAILAKVKDRKKRIYELLEQVNLEQESKKKIGKLSGGMVRRLGIAQALLPDPELLIVDEPTAGLDPEERIRFRNLFALLGETKSIILSTHIVSDIEYSCEKLVILNQGHILYNGTSEGLKEKVKGKIWAYQEEANLIFSKIGKGIDTKNILSAKRKDKNLILKLYGREQPIKKAKIVEGDLEDAYMAIMKEKMI